MAKLHEFDRPMDLVTEFDGSDEDFVPRQKPKYARQLAMVDAESRYGQTLILLKKKRKEDWSDSYDITVTDFSPRLDCTRNTSGMKNESKD